MLDACTIARRSSYLQKCIDARNEGIEIWKVESRRIPRKFQKPPNIAKWKRDYLQLVRIHTELLGPRAYNISTLANFSTEI